MTQDRDSGAWSEDEEERPQDSAPGPPRGSSPVSGAVAAWWVLVGVVVSVTLGWLFTNKPMTPAAHLGGFTVVEVLVSIAVVSTAVGLYRSAPTRSAGERVAFAAITCATCVGVFLLLLFACASTLPPVRFH